MQMLWGHIKIWKWFMFKMCMTYNEYIILSDSFWSLSSALVWPVNRRIIALYKNTALWQDFISMSHLCLRDCHNEKGCENIHQNDLLKCHPVLKYVPCCKILKKLLKMAAFSSTPPSRCIVSLFLSQSLLAWTAGVSSHSEIMPRNINMYGGHVPKDVDQLNKSRSLYWSVWSG